MPTETKNSTANASRSGRASAAACWLTGDCPTTMPARKAPRAIEAPKKSAEPVATVTAIARTVSVKSSRDRRRAASSSMRGTTREPANATRATRAASFSIATPSETTRPREAPA